MLGVRASGAVEQILLGACLVEPGTPVTIG
jgi:hypothetical protein